MYVLEFGFNICFVFILLVFFCVEIFCGKFLRVDLMLYWINGMLYLLSLIMSLEICMNSRFLEERYGMGICIGVLYIFLLDNFIKFFLFLFFWELVC